MELLKGYRILQGHIAAPFITITSYGITFSRKALEDLGFSEWVHVYLNDDERRIAIQACEEDIDALLLVKDPEEARNSSRLPLVRWSNRELTRDLEKMMGFSCKGLLIRVNGEFFKKEKLLVFDMTKVTTAKAQRRSPGGGRKKKESAEKA